MPKCSFCTKIIVMTGILLSLWSCKRCHAQDESTNHVSTSLNDRFSNQQISKSTPIHTLRLDILGIGGLGTIHYEYNRLLKNKFTLGGSIGFGMLHLRDYRLKFNPDLIFPLLLHLLYGNVHQIKLGVGECFSSVPQVDLQADPIHTRMPEWSTIFTLGYRFNFPKKRLFLGCAYTPVIVNNNHYTHWGGISIGYGFK